MHAFIIELENKPGGLAKVLEAIAEKGVNLSSGSAATWGEHGSVALVTNDDVSTRNALEAAGATFREVPVVAAALEHKPGTLADAARRLATAGVNIEALIPTGMADGKIVVSFAVDNAEAGQAALGELAGIATS